MASRWFQPPSLRLDEDLGRERRTGWLELFYDLILVASVSQVALYLAGHLSFTGFLGFTLLFVPVWFSWIGATFFHDRFETDDVSHRLLIFALMAANAAVAVHIPTALTTDPAGFVWSYLGVRAIICFLWWRAGHHSPVARPLTTRYLLGFGLAIGLWLASLSVAGPARLTLWVLAVLTELGTPFLTLRIQAAMPRLSQSHLPERFGLLTLIVLGETVVGAINAVAGTQASRASMGVGLGGLALTFALWWLYFDNVMGRRLRTRPGAIPLWVHAHLWLALALTAEGAGVLHLIRHASSPAVPAAVRWLVCGMAALALVALAVLESTIEMAAEDEHLRWLAPIGAVSLLLTALLGHGLGATPLLAILVGLMALLVLADLLVQPREPADVGAFS
jgi:low temperature requirement protein LtrA